MALLLLGRACLAEEDVEENVVRELERAADHVADLQGLDARALQDLRVGRPEQRVRVDVPVVALLRVAAPDRRPDGLDDDDFATLHWPLRLGVPRLGGALAT